jgi:hypothetical protein
MNQVAYSIQSTYLYGIMTKNNLSCIIEICKNSLPYTTKFLTEFHYQKPVCKNVRKIKHFFTEKKYSDFLTKSLLILISCKNFRKFQYFSYTHSLPQLNFCKNFIYGFFRLNRRWHLKVSKNYEKHPSFSLQIFSRILGRFVHYS